MTLYIPWNIVEDIENYEQITKQEKTIPALIMKGGEYLGLEEADEIKTMAVCTEEEQKDKDNRKIKIELPEECCKVISAMMEEETASMSKAATILIFAGLTSEGWYD